MSTRTDRRKFMQRSSAGAMTLAAAVSARTSQARSANDELVVALIGCGGRGTSVANDFKKVPGVQVAYVCDVDEQRRLSAAKQFGLPPAQALDDMRRVLDDKAVDIALVATPDHWHSPASILACDAGKHVYVEKPISHNIREGRLLVEAAARNKVHVQHGTQSRSTPMTIEAVELLRSGAIGEVLVAKCWNVQRRGTIGHAEPSNPPAGLDYDNWVGPATLIPYQSNRVHNRWTWWYHFGAGDMGNDGVHDIDYTRWGMGLNVHPTKVAALGGKYFFDDDQQFPDTQQVAFEYPPAATGGRPRMLVYEQRLWTTNHPQNVDGGAEFYGTEGQLFVSRRGKIRLLDPRNKPQEVKIALEGPNTVAHLTNLCRAIRDGERLTADALEGHLSTSLCHLGNIATRLGRSLQFDPAIEQVVDDKEANALVRREYRDHWGTPKGA